MSALAVTDIISSNLLSDQNLNPVWEKWRGYFFAGSIVCSLFPFYMTLNGVALHCVPIAGDIRPIFSVNINNVSLNRPQLNMMNGTDVPAKLLSQYLNTIMDKSLAKALDNAGLSASEAAYVNSQCASQDHLLFLRYSGAIMLGIVFLILLASSFWLHIESVKDSINTFSEAREKLQRQVFSHDEMKRMCLQTFKMNESNTTSQENENINPNEQQPSANNAVREVMRLLAYHIKKKAIYTWYFRRCKAMSIGIWIILVVLNILMVTTGHWKNTSKCIIKETESFKSYNEFRCAVNCAQTILVFLVIFSVTLILQTIVFVPPYLKWKSSDKITEHSMHPGNLSVRLLIMFWESASPVQSGLFSEMVRYVHSTDFKKELAVNMTRICEDKDYELIRIKTKLFGDTPEVLVALKTILQRDTRLTRSLNLKVMIDAIKVGQCPLDETNTGIVQDIISTMVGTNQVSYELIVNMLRTCEPGQVEHIVNMIDLQRIEDESLDYEERRTVLFYAFSKEHSSGDHRFAAAKALCARKQRQELKVRKTRARHEPFSDFREYSENPEIPHNTPTIVHYDKTLEEFLVETYPFQEVGKILQECTARIQNHGDTDVESDERSSLTRSV